MKKVLCVLSVLVLACAVSGVVWAEEETGKSLYDKKCASCHGKDGVAHATMGKGSANFNDAAYAASVDEIVKVTMEGKAKMPKYEGKLTADQAKLVADYIQTLKPKK